jgi:hypothetical protein
MSAKESDLKIQAQVILDAIAFTPFEQCQPLNRRFDNIPVVLAFTLLDTKLKDYFTLVKHKIYVVVSVEVTKLFYGHG